MFEFIRENFIVLLLIISSAALLFGVVALFRRGKRKRLRLKKDSSGLWNYHSETDFNRKEAYRPRLKKSESERADAAKDAKEKVAAEKLPAKDGATDSDAEKPFAVIAFRGDLRAKQHESFARLVDEIVINKDLLSEVVVRMTSPGGTVSEYGHVLSEMERLRATGLALTICVDVVAASGGYLASLPATKIIAAPFAVVGSVGVVAFVPNIRGLLTSHQIQPRTFTAGKYKRTVTMTDDAAPEEVERFQKQLESIHRQFRNLVVQYRPSANMDEIETGDHWTAKESMELGLGLVDELSTSADYLLRCNRDRDLIELSERRGFLEEGLGQLLFSLGTRLLGGRI